MRKCPICEECCLIEHFDTTLEWSVCSACGSEQTSYKQLTNNKALIMKKLGPKIDVRSYIHDYVKAFMINCPDNFKAMNESDHNDTEVDFYSQWHIEGSVWSHSMMVLSQLTTFLETDSSIVYNERELILAALFHDIGKPMARFWNAEKQKIVFYGHHSISTILANQFIELVEPDITKEEKLHVLRLINYHDLLFDLSTKNAKGINKFAERFSNSEQLLDDLYGLRWVDFNGNLSTDKMDLSYSYIEKVKDNFVSLKTVQSDKVVTIMIGLPASGKSTIAEAMNVPILSRDNVVMLLSPVPDDYNLAFNTVDQDEVERVYNSQLTSLVTKGKSFVIDKTHMTAKSRNKATQMLKSKGYSVKFVVVMTDLDTIIERNEMRENKTIPAYVIENMMKSFEMPFDNEYDQIEYIGV